MKKLILSGLLALSSIGLFANEHISTSGITFNPMAKSKKSKKSDKPRPEGKGWYINVSGGYGIPFLSTNRRSPLKEVGDKYWYQHGTELEVRPLFGTNGGGFAFNFGWGHMFNKYIGIDVLHTFGWHPERLDAKIDLETYYATQKTGTFGIYVSPHLVMHWDNGKRFGVTGRAGVVAPIFGNCFSRAYINDKQGRVLETLNGFPVIPIHIKDLLELQIEIEGKAKTEFHPTIGASASIGFDVKLNKMLTMFAEMRVQAYTIRLKETVFEEYKQTTTLKVLGVPANFLLDLLVPAGGLPLNIANASEAPKFLTHYVYRNEITEESNTARYGYKELLDLDPNKPQVDFDKPMDEPGQKFNASTLYFNLGLRMNFDQIKKKNK